LLELASAVDRKTLLRLLGIFFVLMFCCCLVLAALLLAAIVHFKPPVPFSFSLVELLIMVGIGGIGCSIAGVAASWVAVEGAIRHGLIESLTVQAGDEELVAKVRRQNFWVVGASVAAVVLILVTLMAFSETLDPFLHQWNWLLQLFNVAVLIVFLIQIFRRPRPITRPGSAEHS
jgi:MFS family permease